MPPEPKKVLIVEDEASISQPLTDSLEHEGIMTLRAMNGEDGLAMALQARPDLILLDILMPKMDGLSMLKKLREDPEGKRVPVLVLTNLSEVTTVANSLEEGISDYLVKSEWSMDDVVTRVKERLGLTQPK